MMCYWKFAIQVQIQLVLERTRIFGFDLVFSQIRTIDFRSSWGCSEVPRSIQGGEPKFGRFEVKIVQVRPVRISVFLGSVRPSTSSAQCDGTIYHATSKNYGVASLLLRRFLLVHWIFSEQHKPSSQTKNIFLVAFKRDTTQFCNSGFARFGRTLILGSFHH